jgi:hypothetical protein
MGRVERIYTYVHVRDGRRIEIFQDERRDGPVYLIREGAGQDSVADHHSVELYRGALTARGYRLVDTASS